MANKKKTSKGKTISRTPEASIQNAKSNMKTDIKPGINSEIKDIVNDILNGNLKKVMHSDIAKKIGIKENDETNLDEKELILGGKKVSNDLDDDSMQEKENLEDVGEEDLEESHSNVTDLISTVDNFKNKADNATLSTSKPLSEDEKVEDDADVELKLSEMGYGADDDEVVSKETGMDGVEDEVELDLSSVGYDVSEEELELDQSNELVKEEDDEQDPEMSPAEDETEMSSVEGDVEMGSVEGDTEIDSVEGDVEMGSVEGDVEMGSVEGDTETPEVEVSQMGYEQLSDEDKAVVDEAIREADSIRKQMSAELAGIDESILPKEKKEKLEVYFEMLTDEKAKIISKKTVANVIEHTDAYMKRVVSDFVKSKQSEIKEAIESTKKAEIFEDFKYMVEKLYGTSTTDILESKKTEEFLINVISEMKKTNSKLEKRLVESKNVVDKMRCTLIFNEATKNMIYTDKERVAEFMESFDYSTSKDFKNKLDIVIEKIISLNENKKTVKDIKKTTTRTLNINEKKISNAVKKQKLNETNVDIVEEIDPNKFNSSFF